MQLRRALFKIVASFCALAAWSTLGAAKASAAGTFVIQHYDGRVNTYKDVAIKVLHGALFVTTKDGRGTLIIHRAACSYQEKLLVCFATSATLVQAGKTSPLDLKTGTVYFNSTGDPQPLVLSSTKIPPHSILLSLSTKRGTYASLSGRLDQVVK